MSALAMVSGEGFDLEPVKKITRDIKKAAFMLTDDEARYLVDAYHQMQDNRMRARNQERSLTTEGEPCEVISWYGSQSEALEESIRKALDAYSLSKPIGEWARGVCGIGPVIVAELMAHIDIRASHGCGENQKV